MCFPPDEKLIPISLGTKYVPYRVSVETLRAWSKRGVRGIILETSLIGGRVFTTEQAIRRFLGAVDEAYQPVSA